jgi:hypothetical protein
MLFTRLCWPPHRCGGHVEKVSLHAPDCKPEFPNGAFHAPEHQRQDQHLIGAGVARRTHAETRTPQGEEHRRSRSPTPAAAFGKSDLHRGLRAW